MKELLFEFGPVAGWIAATITVCTFFWRKLRKPLKDFEDMKRHTRENWMSLLKMQVWMDELPLAERVDAGAEYVNNNGNGLTKAKHVKNTAELERQVQAK